MNNEQLKLGFDVVVNASVSDLELFRLSRQAAKVLRLFVGAQACGSHISTWELRSVGLQYNARLYEVRRHLIRYGWCIDQVGRSDTGICFYEMVPLRESTFYKKHWQKLQRFRQQP